MNKTEQGRSMVEMLGVLAVIGVLTIIGIAGFRYALNKHYANQTVERLMRRAVVVAGQANFGQNLSLHEFDENDGEYPISPILEKNSESFTMTVNEVPQEVCQQIVGLEWKLAKIIPENCSDETMEFMFLNDLTDCTGCQPETFPCEDYGTECGKCSPVKGYTRNDDDCTDDNKRYCVMGRCSKCPAGQTIYNGDCTACSSISVTVGEMPVEDCHQCIDTQDKPTHFRINLGHCIKCDVLNSWPTSLEECNRCPNRCLRQYGSHCVVPGVGLNIGYVNGNGGYCDCAEGYYMNENNQCLSCSEINTTILNNPEDCYKCVNEQGNPTHFRINLGHCVSCDNIYAKEWETSLEECNRCSNRCFGPNDRCYIYGPGQTYTGKDDDGYCVQ